LRIPRTLAIGWAFALATPLIVLANSTAYATGETCDGKPATIVISSEPDLEEFGTAGDDVVVITTPDAFTFDAEGGDDTVCAGPGTTQIHGRDGNDTIDLTAAQGNGRADGGAGDDTILGGDQTDYLSGGDGNDTISGGPGDDVISGDAGDDLVMGGTGNDSVSGGSDGQGTSGTDVVQGGDGDDLVYDTPSDETLDGGSGTDTLTLRPSDEDSPEVCGRLAPTPTPVLSVVQQTVTGLGNDTFSGFEVYQGGQYHDTLIGGPGPDVLENYYCGEVRLLGEGGDDTLVAHSCDAEVAGGPGDDSITFDGQSTGRFRGGRGDDRFSFDEGNDYSCGSGSPFEREAFGGPGKNWLVIPSSLTPDRDVHRVDLYRGVVWSGHTPWAHLFRIQNFRQVDDHIDGSGPLRIVGTPGPNVLLGGPGPTLIFGRQGNDVIRGGSGHDVVYGGKGHDRCRAEVRHECEAR
jgi:Ca2+-binding RTX toxin-like protein